MALPVIEAERVTGVAFLVRYREYGRGVETTGKENYGFQRISLSQSSRKLSAWDIAPQVFVQLNLQAHRQLVFQYPAGQKRSIELAVAG